MIFFKVKTIIILRQRINNQRLLKIWVKFMLITRINFRQCIKKGLLYNVYTLLIRRKKKVLFWWKFAFYWMHCFDFGYTILASIIVFHILYFMLINWPVLNKLFGLDRTLIFNFSNTLCGHIWKNPCYRGRKSWSPEKVRIQVSVTDNCHYSHNKVSDQRSRTHPCKTDKPERVN